MSSTSDILQEIIQESKHYAEIKISLFKINLIEKTTRLVGMILSWLIGLFLGSVIFLFFGFSLASELSSQFHSEVLGYLTVGILFVIALIVFLLVGMKIIYKIIANHLVQLFYAGKSRRNDTHISGTDGRA